MSWIRDNMSIIAFSGKMGVGKDYIALEYCRMLPPCPTVILALADHFKIDRMIKDGLKYEEVYHRKTRDSRLALQKYGAKTREKYGKDIWIKILLGWIRVHRERGMQRFLITDVRYRNEFEALKKIGATIIRIKAPQRNKQRLLQEADGDHVIMEMLSSHPSEVELDDTTDWDHLIHNDPDDDLESQLFMLTKSASETMPLKNYHQ